MTQGNDVITRRILRASSAVLFAFVLTVTSAAVVKAEDGIIKVKSAYSVDETIERLKQDITARGIEFLPETDPSRLALNAGVMLRPSTLLVFGNPPLGALLLTSNPSSGLNWPARLLVIENEQGDVYTASADYDWIAQRHRIAARWEQLAAANQLVASIAASVRVQ